MVCVVPSYPSFTKSSVTKGIQIEMEGGVVLLLETIGYFNKVLSVSQWYDANSALLVCSFDCTKLEYWLQPNKIQNI